MTSPSSNPITTGRTSIVSSRSPLEPGDARDRAARGGQAARHRDLGRGELLNIGVGGSVAATAIHSAIEAGRVCSGNAQSRSRYCWSGPSVGCALTAHGRHNAYASSGKSQKRSTKSASRYRESPEGLPAHHRLKAVGSSARLKAPEARHERFYSVTLKSVSSASRSWSWM